MEFIDRISQSVNCNSNVSISLIHIINKNGAFVVVEGGRVKTRVATFCDNGFLESHPGIREV